MIYSSIWPLTLKTVWIIQYCWRNALQIPTIAGNVRIDNLFALIESIKQSFFRLFSVMSELLFECYDVPAICYGIDSLFSFSHNNLGQNGLIVSIGYYTVHIIPVLNGAAEYTKIRRINLGGFQIITFLHRLLQLKYPVHVNAISLSRVEWLLHTHCSVAYDYFEELKKWSSFEFYELNVKKIQLPYNVPVSSTNVTLTGMNFPFFQVKFSQLHEEFKRKSMQD